MIPTVVILELVKEALRLINNIIEGKPIEQRNAEALILFELAKPLFWPLLSEDARKMVDGLMSRLAGGK